MYPKDRHLGSKAAQQIPPNLLTLFAHIMCRTTEGGSTRESTASHSWDEVLQPAAGGGKKNSHPFPMNAEDWCKAEVFSDHLQSLIAAYHTQSTATDSVGGRRAAVQNGNCAASASSGGGGGTTATSASHAYANGKAKGKGRPAQQSQSQPQPAGSHARSSNVDSSNGTATPAPADVAMPRQHCPRVTPREPSRSSAEPSAPTKVVGRVAASRRVNGVAEGAVASLAVSRAGPGAFETPSHAHHDMASPRDQRVGGGAGAGNSADQTRSREHSPSRYPARLRSRRFPQLGGGGETPELPPDREMDTGHDGDDVEGDNDPPNGIRRLSPRTAHSSAEQHYPNGWIGGAGDDLSPRSDHGVEDAERDGHGMRSRDIPKPPRALMNGGAHSVTSAGAVTPQPSSLNTASPPPVNFGGARPIMGSSGMSAGGSNTKPKAAPRPRQVLQSGGGGGGRSGSRTPVPRSSVGGRNYTDNHVKQLILIEAAVVASATQQDHATYNLPRQGRTLTLTNVFKFVALRGAGVMYSLANAKQVEAHTGRHSNFFDGKIDARIVAIIRKDIGDEAITKSRKFSKILLSLIAEGCTSPDCDWDYNTFTTENIARMQMMMEAETGTSALHNVINPAAAIAAITPSSPPGLSSACAASGPTNGGPSKRRLDLGKDDGQTPSPRLKKLKRNARARFTGAEKTPVASAVSAGEVAPSANHASPKSPPKEEDDMRAAEVLQGLKGIGGN